MATDISDIVAGGLQYMPNFQSALNFGPPGNGKKDQPVQVTQTVTCANQNPASVYADQAANPANPSNMGAEVIKLVIEDPGGDPSPCDYIKSWEEIADQGLSNALDGGAPNPVNKYVWSSACDGDGKCYFATFNFNVNYFTAPGYLSLLASGLEQWEVLDHVARIWTGSPVAHTEGSQIFALNEADGEWTLEFAGDPRIQGFRSGVNYNNPAYGSFVAFGSANSVKGPTVGLPTAFGILAAGARRGLITQQTMMATMIQIITNPSLAMLFDTPPSLYSAQVAYGTKVPSNLGGAGAQVYTNQGGEGDWAAVDDHGTLSNFDRSIRSMCTSQYSQKIWFGTETLQVPEGHEMALEGACSSVVSWHPPTDGSDAWERFEFRPSTHGGFCPNAVSACVEYDEGKMLFGSWNYGRDRHELILIDETDPNGPTATVLSNTPTTDGGDGIMAMKVFDGCLVMFSYDQGGDAGTQGYKLCGDVATANANDWVMVVDEGFVPNQVDLGIAEPVNNDYAWSMATVGDLLLVGTLGGSEKAQLWASLDGEEWGLCNANSFGNELTLGLRSMAVSGDTVYVGTASLMTEVDFNSPPYTLPAVSTGNTQTMQQGTLAGMQGYAATHEALMCLVQGMLD